MAKLKIDSELCKGCLVCTTACPKGLLAQGHEFNSMGYYCVVLQGGEQCNCCTLCAEMCPDVAITLEK